MPRVPKEAKREMKTKVHTATRTHVFKTTKACWQPSPPQADGAARRGPSTRGLRLTRESNTSGGGAGRHAGRSCSSAQ